MSLRQWLKYMKTNKYSVFDMSNNVLEEDVCQFVEQFELWNQLKGKTFLMTGATGLIGSVMIKCLLELNNQRQLDIKILAVVRNLEKADRIFGPSREDLNFLQIELKDVNADNVGQKVDYVIHLASPTASKFFVEHPVETLRTSIEGTISVLEYAKSVNIEAMVFASSLEVYGRNTDDQLIDESYQGYLNPLEVRSSYNMGKRAAECLCNSYAEEYGLPIKIARLTQTTGAGIAKDDNRVIVQFARLAAEGRDIVLHTTGEAARPYCYTTDAVSAILYLLLRGEIGEAYNVANEDTYISARGMAEYLKQYFNPHINVRVEIKDNMGYAPVTKLRLSSQKLMALGWRPKYNLNDIFEKLIKSLR